MGVNRKGRSLDSICVRITICMTFMILFSIPHLVSIENDTTLVSFESCKSMTAVCLGVLQNYFFVHCYNS